MPNEDLKHSIDLALPQLTCLDEVEFFEGGRAFCSPSQSQSLSSTEYLERLFHHSGCARINLMNDVALSEEIQLPPGFFSWFILFPKGSSSFNPAFHSELEIEVGSCEILSDRDVLIKAWQLDYISPILGKFSESFQKRQIASFEERLYEGTHFLYRLKSQIVGHACFVEDVQSATLTPNLYWHQWVDRAQNIKIRRAIHSHFFSSLKSQSLMGSSGVATQNLRALRHCKRNGFFPVIRSIVRGI